MNGEWNVEYGWYNCNTKSISLELWPAVKQFWWRIGWRRWTPSLILYWE